MVTPTDRIQVSFAPVVRGGWKQELSCVIKMGYLFINIQQKASNVMYSGGGGSRRLNPIMKVVR